MPIYDTPLGRETKFHTNTKQKKVLQLYLYILMFGGLFYLFLY
jgi:hypothetical protein